MNSRILFRAVCLLPFALAFGVLGAISTPLGAQEALPPGLKPHKRPAANGDIDWTNGFVQARGFGRAKGRSPQDRQMAERAATVVAVRNALALSMGLKIDDKGRLGGVRNGEVRIRGKVKGYKVYLSEWHPDERPPRFKVKVRVPIWGLEGVSSVVYERKHQEASRGVSHVALVRERIDVSDCVLIIDARGTGIEPCLFPSIIDSSGRVIYDVSVMQAGVDRCERPLRYAETSMSSEELRAWAEISWDEAQVASLQQVGAPPQWPVELMFGFEGSESGVMALGVVSAPPAASQPTTQSSGRRRKRVIQAVKTPTSGDTKIVLTKADAEELAKSAEGASLIRSGRVIVVVDTVAAGVQGRGESAGDDAYLATEQPSN
ncbi:MAG: hypothetical protein KF841_08830 [Phycisphaerae bacterium]|nr:hypothetical protein [Phycisphaerae bacterium]